MISPINVKIGTETKQLVCAHWKTFPPVAAILAKLEKLSLSELILQNKISKVEYEQGLVWQKHCGKHEMDAKCLECKLARYAVIDKQGLPCLSTLDGKIISPVVDIPTLESKMSRTLYKNYTPPVKK